MRTRIGFRLLSVWLLMLVACGAAFAQSERKIAHAILIDNTGSLRSQFPQVRALGRGVVARVIGRGTVSTFHFKSAGEIGHSRAEVMPGLERSTDKSAVDYYVDGLEIVPGQTALMDAIQSVAKSLSGNTTPAVNDSAGRAVIVVITDGEDRASKVKEKQLIKELKAGGIKVYAIGLVRELDDTDGFVHKSKRTMAEDFLRKLTKETGGRAVFPKAKQTDVDTILNELFAEPAP